MTTLEQHEIPWIHLRAYLDHFLPATEEGLGQMDPQARDILIGILEEMRERACGDLPTTPAA
jgi:hypothetical protein